MAPTGQLRQVWCAVYRSPVPDALTVRYGDLLTGTYDCVDRIVLNAYFALGHGPGGFRTWWRRWQGGDDNLDNTHLMPSRPLRSASARVGQGQ